jgi:hypothetical protein
MSSPELVAVTTLGSGLTRPAGLADGNSGELAYGTVGTLLKAFPCDASNLLRISLVPR